MEAEKGLAHVPFEFAGSLFCSSGSNNTLEISAKKESVSPAELEDFRYAGGVCVHVCKKCELVQGISK